MNTEVSAIHLFYAIVVVPYFVFPQPVRLHRGTIIDHKGRLDVYKDGSWGSIAFALSGSNAEADVVCRQLGYRGLSLLTNPGVFSKGYGRNSYESIDCGYYYVMPKNIGECDLKPARTNKGAANKYTNNYEDIGVLCNVTTPPSIRLVGGSGPHEGRLEVFFFNEWGTVCEPPNEYNIYQRYGRKNADLICRHLGFAGVSMLPVSSTNFGYGKDRVWLSELRCDDEATLHDCVKHWGNTVKACKNHRYDVAIICNATVPAPAIRLVNGSGPHEGRVEIQYNNEWGSMRIGSALWSPGYYVEGAQFSAAVICRQLGFGDGESYETSVDVFGPGTGTMWNRVSFCSGTPEFPCIRKVNPVETTFNLSRQDIGVICNVTSSPPARLVDGSVPSEGRLEMKFRNEWGTVCNRAITTEAEVTAMCRLLGYSGRNTNVSYLTTTKFGNGDLQRIWFYSGSCLENTPRMTLCAQPLRVEDGVARYACNYSEADSAVGISCDGSTAAAPIRLVGGSAPSEGRLEIFYGGEWGTVCVKDFESWGQTEANAVCHQLGYNAPFRDSSKRVLGIHKGTSASIFGESKQSKIWLDRVQCSPTNNDTIVKDCDHGEWGGSGLCDHSNDVGVVCGVKSALPPMIRLRDSGKESHSHIGRLEVFFQREWGTVCFDKDWDYGKLPEVICKQIGLSEGPSLVTREFRVGDDKARIWLDRVWCDGTEDRIDSCRHAAWGSVTCDHSMDISIECDVFRNRVSPMVYIVVLGLVLIVIIVVFLRARKYIGKKA